MSRHYGQIAFTEDVRAVQERNGSGSHVAPPGGAAAEAPVDYAGQRRLKVYGRARVQDASDAPDLITALADVAGPSVVERVVTVAVAAYDWNCPRHIVRRFTARELQPQVLRIVSDVEALRDENRGLRDQLRLALAVGMGES
jgi:hypothetical protein